MKYISDFVKNINWNILFTIFVSILIIIMFCIFIQSGFKNKETIFVHTTKCIDGMKFIYWQTDDSSGLVQEFDNYFEPKRCEVINE